MESVENSTSANQARRKNNFSIENILARPDSNFRETRDVRTVKFLRQNPFQNNHVLFNQNNNFMIGSHNHELRKANENEIKMEEESHLEIVESSDDHETQSEIASDDGNNSNSGNCKIFSKVFFL